jgi:MoaA/NifB/PqqE/SkfB family radical SAM enzyme
MNALTYITRRCYFDCDYCNFKDSSLGEELTPAEWIEAFKILHEIGVKFNLILGNESWIIGEPLIDIIKCLKDREVSYALYTTCYKPLWHEKLGGFRKKFFSSKIIDNLSCGVDYPYRELQRKAPKYSGIDLPNDMMEKSWLAFDAFRWIKKPGGWWTSPIDCQGTITMHKGNAHMVLDIIRDLTALWVFSGLNIIHYNSDGKFDMFPRKEEMPDMAFSKADWGRVKYVFDEIKDWREDPNRLLLLQNADIYDNMTFKKLDMGWHCKGDPYGGPTIDADGSLRCCGYRKGEDTPIFTIWDLADPKKEAKWKKAMKADADKCPGCCWSYPMMWDHHKDNPKRHNVFSQHDGEHIPDDKVSSWR